MFRKYLQINENHGIKNNISKLRLVYNSRATVVILLRIKFKEIWRIRIIKLNSRRNAEHEGFICNQPVNTCQVNFFLMFDLLHLLPVHPSRREFKAVTQSDGAVTVGPNCQRENIEQNYGLRRTAIVRPRYINN